MSTSTHLNFVETLTETHFKQFISSQLGEFYEKSLMSVERTKMEKLYGFNNHKKLAFLKLSFKNETAFNKAKKLWYTEHKNYKKNVQCFYSVSV